MVCFTIWRTGAKFQVLSNLATYSNYLITNYIKIPMFHFFGKVNKGQSKMVNVNFKNGQISLDCHFNQIIRLSYNEIFAINNDSAFTLL